jgi:hypothetical protein
MREILLEKLIISKFLKKFLLSWNSNLHFQVRFYSAGFELTVSLKIKRKCACAMRQFVGKCVCACACAQVLFLFQLLKNLTDDVFALVGYYAE